jgi:hypothetical protein
LKFQQETPTKEILVTDGNVLWWYIQAKNQAHRYSAHQLSQELKLLGDIFQGLRGVEQSFVILQKGEDEKGALILEVTPSPSWGDIDHIDLTITPGTFHIQKVEIYNLLGGLTRFKLGDSVKEERFKDDRFMYRIPGAENYADVANRVKPFMQKLLRVHEGHEVLIVGHRVVNRLLIGMLMQYPLEQALKIEQTNDMLYLIQRNGEAKDFFFNLFKGF